MRRIQLLFALLATMTVAHGQRDTVRKYLDADLHFTSKRNMAYPALSVRSGDHWVLVAVYPDTTLLAKIYFKDAALSIKDGPYTLCHPGGKPAQDGRFIDNVAEGIWESSYRNGQRQDSGRITGNRFAGLWKHWYETGQLKTRDEYSEHPPAIPSGPDNDQSIALTNLHVTGILNGYCQSWYPNSVLESSGAYLNDTLTGVWKWFREDGTPSSIETYTSGKITQLECYDEKGAFSGSTCSILKPPVFTHPFFSAHDYIMDQLYRVYNVSLQDEDQINIDFIITKEGKITNLAIKNIRSTAIKGTLIRIFEKMPAWSPAISHNRAIDSPLSFTIN